ncbi:MAG: hypothetical protein ACKO23_08475 [Gemmataceae bacterium]
MMRSILTASLVAAGVLFFSAPSANAQGLGGFVNVGPGGVTVAGGIGPRLYRPAFYPPVVVAPTPVVVNPAPVIVEQPILTTSYVTPVGVPVVGYGPFYGARKVKVKIKGW